MKNKVLKYYITAFFFCSTFVLLAQQPGDDTSGGDLEGGDAAPLPIDDYVWILALIGLVFVFLKFRAIQNKKIHS